MNTPLYRSGKIQRDANLDEINLAVSLDEINRFDLCPRLHTIEHRLGVGTVFDRLTTRNETPVVWPFEALVTAYRWFLARGRVEDALDALSSLVGRGRLDPPSETRGGGTMFDRARALATIDRSTYRLHTTVCDVVAHVREEPHRSGSRKTRAFSRLFGVASITPHAGRSGVGVVLPVFVHRTTIEKIREQVETDPSRPSPRIAGCSMYDAHTAERRALRESVLAYRAFGILPTVYAIEYLDITKATRDGAFGPSSRFVQSVAISTETIKKEEERLAREVLSVRASAWVKPLRQLSEGRATTASVKSTVRYLQEHDRDNLRNSVKMTRDHEVCTRCPMRPVCFEPSAPTYDRVFARDLKHPILDIPPTPPSIATEIETQQQSLL